MAFINWQPVSKINIDIVDQQHQMLIKLINDLYQAYTAGRERHELASLLNKLSMYASTHFAREEHFFELYGYPDTDAHLDEHDYFEDTIARFEEEYKSGKQELSIDLLEFLSDWLVNHINKSDLKYAPYLKTRGVV